MTASGFVLLLIGAIGVYLTGSYRWDGAYSVWFYLSTGLAIGGGALFSGGIAAFLWRHLP